MPDHSPEFFAFAQSVLGPIRSRSRLESYDLDALARITNPVERKACELMLIEKIENRDEDPRLAAALAAIGTPEAIQAMRDGIMSYSNGTHTRVALAEALWERDQALPAMLALLQIARSSHEPSIRSHAVAVLATVHGDAIDAALVQSLADETDDTARMAIQIALLERLGLEADAGNPPAAVREALDSVIRAEPSERSDALEGLRTAILAS